MALAAAMVAVLTVAGGEAWASDKAQPWPNGGGTVCASTLAIGINLPMAIRRPGTERLLCAPGP